MTALTLDMVKDWLRHESDVPDNDVTLSVALAAAVRHVEGQTGVLFTQREVTQPIYRLCGRVPLFYGPREGDVVLSYLDTAGAPSMIEVTGFFGAEMLAPASGWPIGSAYVATYTAGHANPDEVPEDLLVAALLLAGNWDANRENTVVGVSATTLPMGVESLIAPYRVMLA